MNQPQKELCFLAASAERSLPAEIKAWARQNMKPTDLLMLDLEKILYDESVPESVQHWAGEKISAGYDHVLIVPTDRLPIRLYKAALPKTAREAGRAGG